MSSTAPVRIGQVCRMLAGEFPDISISKLRFLEEQGLVLPHRTPGGYRMYTHDDIDKLRAILAMQRDEFLPLKVIRDELQRRLDARKAAGGRESGSAREVSLSSPLELHGVGDTCERANVSPEFLEECRGYDIVAGVRGSAGQWQYTIDEVELMRLAGVLDRLGIDARNLRQVRSAIGRQAALVEQFAAARLRAHNPEARQVAIKQVEMLTGVMSEFLRTAFVRDVRAMTLRANAATSGATPAPTAGGRISSIGATT